MRTIKRKTSKNKTYKKKSHRRRQKGGAINEQKKKEIESYIQLVDAYVQKQNEKEINADLEGVKYALFKKKFEEFEQIKQTFKSSPDSISPENIKLLKSLVFFILKSDVSGNELLFDESAAGFQVWINNIVMSLINDAPFKEEVRMKLLQGVIDKKPYVKVSYDKNTNNFVFDVNELLASIQNEAKGEPNKKIVMEKVIKAKGILQPVPAEENSLEEKK
jgi:hypothetical protein